MIKESIKLHAEPSTTVYTSGTKPAGLDEQKEKISAAISFLAKEGVNIGDTIQTKRTTHMVIAPTVYQIVKINTTPEEVSIWYQGNPCILELRPVNSRETSYATKYSVEELDFTTRKPREEIENASCQC